MDIIEFALYNFIQIFGVEHTQARKKFNNGAKFVRIITQYCTD